jgi:predicted dehydrogenase
LGIQAQDFLARAAESEFFDIVAVADSDSAITRKIAKQYDCAAFDDYRQLVIQNQLDVLIVSSPLYECAEYVRLAISKKCNILKLIPTASSFEEAVELNCFAVKNKVKYVTACLSRFTPAFVAMKDCITEIGVETFYFINAFYNVKQNTTQLQSNTKLPRGGVLLNECFGIIDAIVSIFSLPQQLYAVTTNPAPDKKQRQYLPETTAAINMQFTNGLMANFVADSALKTESWSLEIYGREANIVVMPNRFRVYDNNKCLSRSKRLPGLDEKKELLNNFALSILYPAEHKLRYGLSVDLATMAFIDSAYLSAKTATPETPQKIFEISKNKIIGI